MTKVDRIVADLLAMADGEREPALVALCGGDAVLEEQVREMLARVLGTIEQLGIGQVAPGEAGLPDEGGPWTAARTPPRPWLSPGERLGDWEVVAYHAAGGHGEVYRARPVQGAAEDVALKVWPQGSASARQRFERAVGLARAIEHPHLARVLAGGVEDGRGLLYVVMPWIEGPGLDSVLESYGVAGTRPMEADIRLLVARFAEAAGALGALHARGIAHGDVKPANLLFGSSPAPDLLARPLIVVDVGHAPVARDAADGLSTIRLTPAYAAPEILLGHAHSPRGDVFSLGVAMHDLLCARRPRERRRAHTAGLEPVRELVPEVDADLGAIMGDACSVEPRLRPADGAALHAELAAWLAGRPVAARPRSALGRLARRVRRHPWRVLRRGAIWSLLALLLGAAGLGGAEAARGVAAGFRCAGAWRSGDLVACLAAVEEVPGWLAPWALPETLRAAIAGSREPGAEVLRRLRDEGLEEAVHLAACWLERDGLAGHPGLVRFLAIACAARTDERAAAMEALCALFHQRPPRSAAEDAAAAPLREVLRLALATGSVEDPAVLAATGALGGCARPADLQLFAGHLRRCADGSTAISAEGVRLGLAALRRLLNEANRRGLPIDGAALAGAMDDAARATASAAARMGTPRWCWEAFTECQVAAECLARSCGIRLPLLELPDWPAAEPVLAVRRDPALAGRLVAGCDWLPSPHRWLGPDLTTAHHQCWIYGYLTALHGDALVAAAAERCVQSTAAAMGLQRLPGLFAAGRAEAALQLRGRSRMTAADAESRLSTIFAPATRTPLPFERSGLFLDAELEVFEVDLQSSPARVGGNVEALHVAAAEQRADDLLSGVHYLALTSPGRSELTIRFRGKDRLEMGMGLSVLLQRAWRGPMPFGGRVAFDVLVDGRIAVRVPQVYSVSHQEFRFPIGRADAGLHELTIRLAPRSTGVLWVYGISLR